MDARRTGTGCSSLRVTALRIIALILSLGGTTCVVAQAPTGFSQLLQPTEEDQAPEPRAGPSFGAAVAISGTTVLVGMPTHNDRLGRVGVYVRKAEGWVRQATISNPDPQRRESFGRNLDLSVRVAVVDAQSRAYLFRKRGTQWNLIGAFGRSDPLTTLGSRVAYDNGFMARSIQAFRTNEDGSQDDLPGVVRVYQQRDREILQVATLRASDAAPADRFGVSLALHRGVLVVGAPGLGAAYVFVRDGQRWVQRQKLVSSDGGIGGFGASVAIRNGTILVGAPGVDVPGQDQDPPTSPEGKVYAFLLYRGSWFESQRLNDDGRFFMHFGSNVALSRGLAAVVSPFNVPASWSSSTVIAFDRVGAELTSGRGVIRTGNDGASVSDIDASERRIVAGVQGRRTLADPSSARCALSSSVRSERTLACPGGSLLPASHHEDGDRAEERTRLRRPFLKGHPRGCFCSSDRARLL